MCRAGGDNDVGGGDGNLAVDVLLCSVHLLR